MANQSPAAAGYVVQLQTEHFRFEAHGWTEEEANELMGTLLTHHGRQYGLPADWADPYLDSFETIAFRPGWIARDGNPVARG
ncbi:hypothetical protein [Sphingomonas hankookensis]|uniref:hypothetical protein n=1 Tax=Sphingomonas hankookensis TaxID=563996 RepID=UPI003D301B6C